MPASATPFSKPAWKRPITGPSTPPINPTLLVFVVLAAATPAKYADSLSLNVAETTFFLPSIWSSIKTKFVSGLASAAEEIASFSK